jgi:flotillin
MLESVLMIVGIVVIIFVAIIAIASRYRKCPPDKILVVYGKTKQSKPSKCVHGGGAFVIPVFQGYEYLDLSPISMDVDLKNALSEQNIRVSIPSTFTIGISSDEQYMQLAAERLLGFSQQQIVEAASDIIFGQLRSIVSGLKIEEINADRDKFLSQIKDTLTPELEKIGLTLINVNIRDITDASDYIESIGKKAAAEVVNKALVDVAIEEKKGQIGKANEDRDKDVNVAQAHASSIKGQKKAEADRRIFVQQQEADAIKGEKEADTGQRIFVKEKESEAVQGETKSQANIADYNAELGVRQADARQKSDVANLDADIIIQKKNAEAEFEKQTAVDIVPIKIRKKQIELEAEASANKQRIEANGQADAILATYTAEATGIQRLYEAKAEGFRKLVESCGGDANSASTFLMLEKLEDLVKMQTDAIKNIKIDSVQVWDTHSGTTQGFMSGLMGALPPLQNVMKQAGLKLPGFLGELEGKDDLLEDAAKAVTEMKKEKETTRVK